MYGETRAYDYQIVEADQYRGVQVWGLYHVGADFSIVKISLNIEKTVVRGAREKAGRQEVWKGGRGEIGEK